MRQCKDWCPPRIRIRMHRVATEWYPDSCYCKHHTRYVIREVLFTLASPTRLRIHPRRSSNTPHLLLSRYVPLPLRPPQLRPPSLPRTLLRPPPTIRRTQSPQRIHQNYPLHWAFHHPLVRRATLASFVVMITQQMCGINIIAFYSSRLNGVCEFKAYGGVGAFGQLGY